MTLLQILLKHCQETGRPLLNRAQWFVQDADADVCKFSVGVPRRESVTGIWDVRGEHGNFVADTLATDRDQPLKFTPTVRKLVEMVQDKNAGWIVNDKPDGTKIKGRYEWFNYGHNKSVFTDGGYLYLDSNSPIYRLISDAKHDPEKEAAECEEMQLIADQHTSRNPYFRPFTERMKQSVMDAMDDDGHVDWDAVGFDVYDVTNSFAPINSQVEHALKKQLKPGGRIGGKSQVQDLREAIWSLQEAIKELGGEE